jgi:hypothetical protein
MAGKPAGRTLVIAAVALVAAAVLGYWAYSAHKKRELHGEVGAILKSTSAQLREALALEATAPAERMKLAQQLDGYAVATEKSAAALKRLQVERDLALVDSADAHLVTLREIFRKRAAANRLHVLHTESLAALQDHMRADNRTGGWVQQAVRAKERAERDFRDYRLAVATYGTLLGALPDSQKRIAPYVGADALVEDALIVKARERAIETARQATEEMDRVRKLAAPK